MRLDAVIGQESAAMQLKRARQNGRVSHAYIFDAPAGSGAEEMALAWAQLLLCRAPGEDGEPCGHCPACLEMAAGTHPDCIRIRPEGRTVKIAQIRALRKRLATTSVDGGFTVVILYEADTMGIEAANAFLKTLEEPAGPTCFVLLSARAARLPDTVQSRAQWVRFAALNTQQLAQIYPEAAATDAGCLALTLAAGDRSRAAELLGDEEALTALAEQHRALDAFMDGLPQAHPGAVLRFCEGYTSDHEAVRRAVYAIRARLAAEARRLPQAGLVAAFHRAGETLAQLETNTEPSALLAALMIQLAQDLRRSS